MNTTLKVGDWVKVKGTRSFNPRSSEYRSFLGGLPVASVSRYYVERIDENTCHAETQTLCGVRGVMADGTIGNHILSIPAFMLEPDTCFDWTEFDSDIEREKARVAAGMKISAEPQKGGG